MLSVFYVQLDAGKLAVLRAHAVEIERAGRCFITEAGFHIFSIPTANN